MLKILIAIGLIIVFFKTVTAYAQERRQKDFYKKFPIFKSMVTDGKFYEALQMLEKESVFARRYKLDPYQRKDIVELEIDCLEKLNRRSDAVISLAAHLSAVYEFGAWPQDLLARWISLYKSCEPINIEKFYFCQTCGLHPEDEALFEYAIEKEGCNPPVGYPGKKPSGLVIEWSGKKAEKDE